MREGENETPITLAVCAAIVLGMLYFAQFLPASDAYRYAADEGTYFRQATLVARDGVGAFAKLAQSYIVDPREHTAPPPFRVMHLAVAACALRVAPAIRTLSLLSLACHGLTCVALFGLGRRLWGVRAAAAGSLLLLVSPLSAGVSLRALIDAHGSLASTTTLLLFCRYAAGNSAAFRWFLGALLYSLLLKESAYFVWPFYAVALLYFRLTGAVSVAIRAQLVPCLLVPAVACIVTALLLGGRAPFVDAVGIALGFNARVPHAYLAAFGAGPWYEYVIDYLLLSPATGLLALFFVGSVLTLGRSVSRQTQLVCAFVAYFVLVFAALPKNPRFAMPLDPLLRLAAVAMLGQLASLLLRPRVSLAGCAAALVTLMSLDVRGFHRFFVDGGIYDPVAYNLLAVERLIPIAAQPESLPAARVDHAQRAATPGTAEAFLALSLAEYEAKHFAAAVDACRAALRLRPDFAEAYNNLGLAYAGLEQWQPALDAFEEALRIAPDFGLARNNLAWIRSEAAKAHPP